MINAQDRAISLAANQALELAYKESIGSSAGVIFGSQIETVAPGRSGLTLLPRRSPDRRFADQFLDQFRGIKNQLAPDIIDFSRKVFYEFKTPSFANQGRSQLAQYYKEANEIIAQLGQNSWRAEYATWYPPSTITLPGHRERIICTELTDHGKMPGLILYTVWQKL